MASSAEATYTYIPKDYTVPADADYFHVTTNNKENLREKYTAQEIVGKLAYTYGLQPEPAPRTPESLIKDFSWAKVPKQDVCLPEDLF